MKGQLSQILGVHSTPLCWSWSVSGKIIEISNFSSQTKFQWNLNSFSRNKKSHNFAETVSKFTTHTHLVGFIQLFACSVGSWQISRHFFCDWSPSWNVKFQIYFSRPNVKFSSDNFFRTNRTRKRTTLWLPLPRCQNPFSPRPTNTTEPWFEK